MTNQSADDDPVAARRLAPLFVVTDPARRGAQIFAAELHRSFDERGHGVRTVALAEGEPGQPNIGVPGLGRSRLSPGTLRHLRKAIRESSACVGFGSTTLPALAACSIGTSVPFVYRSIGELGFWARRPDRHLWVRAALHRTDRVVVLWRAAADGLARGFHVPADRIVVIPRGVDATRFTPADPAARRQARRELDLREDAPVVAWVGSLSEEKRPELAVQVAARLPADVTLVIAGGGPMADDVAALADEVAPGRVRLLGRLPDAAPVYAAADAVLLTSVTEGMPGVLIEAGLCGLPAVTTAVGAAPEVVLDGVTGAVVPVDATPEQLAARVVEVLGAGDDLGAAARAHCTAHYDLACVADAWEALLLELA